MERFFALVNSISDYGVVSMSAGTKSKLFKEYFEYIYHWNILWQTVSMLWHSVMPSLFYFLFVMLFTLSLLNLTIFFGCLYLCLIVNRLLVRYLHPVT